MQPGDVVRRDDDPGARAADELGSDTVRRNGSEDRPLGGEVLEDLPRRHRAASAPRLRQQEEQRFRVALELERGSPRHLRDHLDAVAEPEPLSELAIG